MKTFRDPPTIHAPLARYSHQVEISGERLLLMAGQVGMRADGSRRRLGEHRPTMTLVHVSRLAALPLLVEAGA